MAQAPEGATNVVLFDDQETYYRYASHAYAEPGEYATSGGMYIDQPFGHFIAVKAEITALELVIAHEMTHASLAHLPLPLWLNEGLAVNTEHQLTRQPPPLYSPQELHARHRKHWTPQRIKAFWSGEAFHDAESQLLAYDLARILVEQLSSDWPRFARFACVASVEDSGARAARDLLGIELGECVRALLELDSAEGLEPDAGVRRPVHEVDYGRLDATRDFSSLIRDRSSRDGES